MGKSQLSWIAWFFKNSTCWCEIWLWLIMRKKNQCFLWADWLLWGWSSPVPTHLQPSMKTKPVRLLNTGLCVCVCACVRCMCTCVDAHTCVCTCEGQRKWLGVLLCHFLPYSFETGSLTEAGVRPIGRWAPAILLSLPLTVQSCSSAWPLPPFYVTTRELDSTIHT